MVTILSSLYHEIGLSMVMGQSPKEKNGEATGNRHWSFPKNILQTSATGKLLHNAHDSRHLLAGFLFSERHIFMQTLSTLSE
jgi:hypothetical protein